MWLIENGKMCIFDTLSFLFWIFMSFIYSGSILELYQYH